MAGRGSDVSRGNGRGYRKSGRGLRSVETGSEFNRESGRGGGSIGSDVSNPRGTETKESGRGLRPKVSGNQ